MRTRTHRHNLKTLTKTGNVERTTPHDVFAWLDAQFNFTVDVASTHANALCPRHYTKEDNGLAQSWAGERAFMNPPFGKAIGEWVGKARHTCETSGNSLVCCVLPARVDAEWWREHVTGVGHPPNRTHQSIAGAVTSIRYGRLRTCLWFFGERVKFDGLKTGAPFPTAIVVFSSAAMSRPEGRAGHQWTGWKWAVTSLRPDLREVWP